MGGAAYGRRGEGEGCLHVWTRSSRSASGIGGSGGGGRGPTERCCIAYCTPPRINGADCQHAALPIDHLPTGALPG